MAHEQGTIVTTPGSFDAAVLGRILLMQSGLSAAVDEEGIAEVVTRGLAGVPGVAEVHLCLEGRILASSPHDGAAAPACGLGTRADGEYNGCGPTCPLFLAAAPGKKFDVATVHRLLGALIFRLSDPGAFERYEPFISNTANLVALRLEIDRAAARRSEDPLLFETMTEGVLYHDRSGRITSANPSAEKLLGLSAERMIGRTLMDLEWQAMHEDGSRFSPDEYPTQVVLRTGKSLKDVRMGIIDSRLGSWTWLTFNAVPHFHAGQVTPYRVLTTFRDITERKQAEIVITESEGRYRSLFDNMRNGFAYCRMLFEEGQPRDFVYLKVNGAFEKLTGLTDVVGRKVTDVIPGIRDSNPELFEIYGRVARTGTPEAFETYVGPLEIWFSISVYRPQPDHFVAVFDNITERKRAEGKVRESANILRNIMESSTDTIFVMDTSLRMVLCNSVLARMVGKQPVEMYGKTDIENGWSPDLVKGNPRKGILGWERDDLSALAGNTVRAIEEPMSVGPEVRYFDTVKIPLRDYGGTIIGMLGIGRDVTEIKQASLRLQEQAALLDITADAIIVRDMEHKVTFLNKGAERMYGWSMEEMRGLNADELLRTTPAELLAAHAAVLDKGAWSGEFHHVSRDGRALIVEARWTLVRDARGNPTGVLAVNTDVTERRATQAQLLRVQRLESLGTLASGIAHDLNNVLSPILMGAEGLSIQHADPDSRKIIEIIKTAAQRGASIVRQVLSFARGQEGDRAEVQLKHILREIEQIITETFPKSVEIVTHVPRDLHPILCDATQLHQVLMNLCLNARDAMPDGGKLTISAENVRLDETYARMHIEARPIRYVVLKVEDTGTGMPPGVLEKIFDPFFTTKEPGKGTGLGLSTARTIVKSHGGFINVYSEVRRGASFKVYIPAAEQEVPSSRERVREGIPMGEGELILVVDDEGGVREIARQILESYGYTTITAGDGAEGVALYVQHKEEIRAVITDLMMPYMDGTAMARALLKIDPEARIIATSGLLADDNPRHAADLGVKAFLVKPYTAEALLEMLHRVLSAPPHPRPA